MSGTIPAVLVVGATGVVGLGVVAAALAAGHPVIAVARDRARLRALRRAHPDAALSLIPMAVDTDEHAASLARALRRRGRRLLGVVAALRGEPMRGRVLDQPAAALGCALECDLLPHLALARALLPQLAPGQGYVLVGGPGDETPWIGYGHRSIAAAALRMLACVLHEEARAHGVRVQLLAIGSPVRGSRNARCACPDWPTAERVGAQALAMLTAQA
ncbi:MAG TPA: SDR family oxidoreductase, partial [Lysobacter sp.]|nr:SDR family oxidoreductase [Lysobacter sp.]